MNFNAFDQQKIHVLIIKMNMLLNSISPLLLKPFAMLFTLIWVLSSPHLNSTYLMAGVTLSMEDPLRGSSIQWSDDHWALFRD